ncbi:ATP synthase F1 subunit gamma [Tautonia sociabilis]|uniref:ATP synthase gamma chain n=1 Tax=Tautonia sociabilis TaxID=2080755 RepID=A0A432MQ86_9BACT|nr:ATP synthase F1 subunit gamma [Tautonia sociabilis]RUL89520.1 ATP synthase F1 subunit gamma [Tautonia sociabilis]
MAKARAIIKRRKAVQNIKKITRTMELIATARFRKALDRATQAEAYTRKIAEIVADLRGTSSTVAHPLLEERDPVRRAAMLVLTSNRGLAGAYNGSVLRLATREYDELQEAGTPTTLEVSGKRGIAFLRFRRIPIDASYTQFEDRPQFEEVEVLANRFIGQFLRGEIDKLQVVYTKFLSSSRQVPVTETLLPMTVSQVGEDTSRHPARGAGASSRGRVPYEFLPDPESILEEIVPTSFKIRLFKCFLDAAVSEQIMRMIAMRGATENANEMVKSLTRQYNRARQSQITRELSEIIGGAAALE